MRDMFDNLAVDIREEVIQSRNFTVLIDLQCLGESSPVLSSVGHDAASCFVTPSWSDVGAVVFGFGGEASARVELARSLGPSKPSGEAIGRDHIGSGNEERFVSVKGNDFLVGGAINSLIDSNSVCD